MMLVNALTTESPVITVYKMAPNAAAAMVPIAYSTVDMPSSSTTNNVSRAHSARILLTTTMTSPHLLSAVTEFLTPVRHRPTRQPRGRCPNTRTPAGSRGPAAGQSPPRPARGRRSPDRRHQGVIDQRVAHLPVPPPFPTRPTAEPAAKVPRRGCPPDRPYSSMPQPVRHPTPTSRRLG